METILENPPVLKLSDIMAKTVDKKNSFNFSSFISDENEKDYKVKVFVTVVKDTAGFFTVESISVNREFDHMTVPLSLISVSNLNNLKYEAIMKSIDMANGVCFVTGAVRVIG